MTYQIANPEHAELEDLLAAAQSDQSWTSSFLDHPAYLMGAGGAWTGTCAAAAFAAELEGRRGDLPGFFDRFIEEVRHRMSQVPETKTITTLGGPV